MTRIRSISAAAASRWEPQFSCLRVLTAATLALWVSGGFAASDEDWLEQMQAQELLLTELESTRGPLDPELVAPLQTMIELMREQSEFERAAELLDRLLAVMETNAGEQSPDWIPALKEMVTSRVNSGETDGVEGLLRQMRILNAARHDYTELIRTIELEAHWLMTEGAGTVHAQRISSFIRAQEILTNRFAYLIGELFEQNDPRTVPWLYQVARNSFQLLELIDFDFRNNDHIQKELERQIPLLSEIRLRINYLIWIHEIGEHFSAVDDLEGQAMAKLYEADFVLFVNRSKAFELYAQAYEMLREADVPEERIRVYFSRPQLIPTSHFYSTLEEAIVKQDADLAAWRPEQQGVAHVGTFTAWNDTSPVLAMPVSDHAFWNPPSSYYQAILKLNISSSGSVSAVDMLEFEPEDREVRRKIRRAVQRKRFRPAMEEGRGQRLRDVHMRVLIPRGED